MRHLYLYLPGMKQLCVMICLCSLVHGSIKITSVEKQEVPVGTSVTLQCQLVTAHQNVVQITWTKESGNFTGPVATYSKEYGPEMIGYSRKRTKQHTVDTLNVTAITFYPVVLEDQGCFTCIFNIYPFGANSEKTCLDIIEINLLDPRLEIYQTNSSGSSHKLHIVTCSATGYPAPNITWTLPDNVEMTPETYTIVNPNRTITVISNFTQRVTRRVTGVTCVVRHPALSPEKRLASVIVDTDYEGSSSSTAMFRIIGVSCIVVVAVGVVCFIQIYQYQKRKNLKSYDLPPHQSTVKRQSRAGNHNLQIMEMDFQPCRVYKTGEKAGNFFRRIRNLM